MTRILVAALLAGVTGFGVTAQVRAQERHSQQEWCDPRDSACHSRNRGDREYRGREYRDRERYDRRDYRGRPPSYGSQGACTFNGPRGPVAGYRPEGKDRCCVETRNGPSCQ